MNLALTLKCKPQIKSKIFTSKTHKVVLPWFIVYDMVHDLWSIAYGSLTVVGVPICTQIVISNR